MNLLYDWIRNENVQAWAELTNHLAVVDRTDEFYEAEDLLEELHEPGMEPELDTVAVWDANRLVGYAQLRVGHQLREGLSRVSITGGVHLDYRRQGVGTRLMDIMESRARQKSAQLHPGAPAAVDMWGNTPGHGAGALAEARGYAPARFFQDMTVKAEGFRKSVTDLWVNDSLAVFPYSPEWAEEIRLLDNEAFADHWGSTPKTAEEWEAMTSARTFRAECSRILVEEQPGGLRPTVLSYVLSSEWVPNKLYVARVGTARGSRGRGYAGWLMSDVIAAALADGFTEVGLSVDAQSPTGAVSVYERLGFSVTRTGTMYRKVILQAAETSCPSLGPM
ncbi:GNAT family N-acetyltransferase [Paeniglutamicibacter sp. NPDC012692]|uniref:GNAT family N-acetyltransferase n=1 Tax=Paeniglutamicibacter sp. NPDC012692 TaxID=3364388 RepID=UPI0036A72E0E